MRVTIKGLTDSTIAFNTIGIILRGNSSKPDMYPNSTARSIDIKTEEQMRELVGLKNAKLIEYTDDSETPVKKLTTQLFVTPVIKPLTITKATPPPPTPPPEDFFSP